MSKFTKGGESITYMDYFKQAYQQTITNNKQPLLKVIGRMRREIKNGKLMEEPEYIYLIPELVSPTGMRD